MRTRLVIACVLLLVGADTVQARREQSFRYPFARVWSAAMRMMRVDYESPITEKDVESGYFLFTFPQNGKENPGSAELVRTLEGGVESVRVVMQVPALPNYVEQMMLDRLKRKLSEEFGDPTPTKKPKPEEGEQPEPGQPGQPPAHDKAPAPQQPKQPVAPQ
ncbi:MAG TPA: hypothetical protein VK509_17850 [Polyangiales bacterium]|nr:hypothetical protein [Polyangiales bacterium]